MTWAVRTLYVVSLLYACIAMLVFPKWTIDDAYITYRYAENLARHSALTWNVDAPAVEGYTGVALPVVLAALFKLGIPPLLASKLLGVSAYAAGAIVLFLLLRQLGLRAPPISITLMFYLTAPLLFAHAWSGLETLPFSAAVLACLLLLHARLADSQHAARREITLFCTLLLTSFIRPEGVALSAVCFGALAYAYLRYRPGGFRRFGMRGATVYLLPALAYFLWRWNYYGRLLPNTFYAKAYQGAGYISVGSLLDMFGFVQICWLFFLLAGLTFLIALRRPDVSGSRSKPASDPPAVAARILYGACLIFLLLLGLQYLRSNLVQNLGHRFFVPYFVIGLIGCGTLLDRGFLTLPASGWKLKYRLATGIIFLLTAAQLLLFTRSYRPSAAYFDAYRQLLQDEHLVIGAYLRTHIPGSESLIVVEDAGAIPYLSELKTVDFGKLNDRYLASDSHSVRERADYFFSFNAGVVVFNSFNWDRIEYSPATDFLVDDPRFGRYRLAFKARSDAWPDYYEFVYVRNDLAAPAK